MALHGLAKATIGVPNVDEAIAYYTDFGLTRAGAACSPPATGVTNWKSGIRLGAG